MTLHYRARVNASLWVGTWGSFKIILPVAGYAILVKIDIRMVVAIAILFRPNIERRSEMGQAFSHKFRGCIFFAIESDYLIRIYLGESRSIGPYLVVEFALKSSTVIPPVVLDDIDLKPT